MTDKTADEKIDDIANACLEKIEAQLKESESGKSETFIVKDIGEALKALAEGVKACKEAMKEPKKMATPSSLYLSQ